MIEVRIRHIDQTTAMAAVLGEVPLDRLSEIIPTLTAWGLTVDGDDEEHLVGQFVLDTTRQAAYFEIMVGGDG